MHSHWLAAVLVMILTLVPSVASAQAPGEFELTFEDGKPGGEVAGWSVPVAGFKAEITADQAAEGKQCVKLYKDKDADDPMFGNFMRAWDAAPYRGKHVVLTAKVRVEGEPGSRAQMWLRVDRANGKQGAFDNMGNRPILAGEWADAKIEADINSDGKTLNIGFMAIAGPAAVYIDKVTLTVTGDAAADQKATAPKALTERGLENLVAAARLLGYVRFFCPTDQAAGVKAWDHFAVEVMDKVEDAKDGPELAERLSKLFAPLAPTLEVWAGKAEAALPPKPEGAKEVSHWQHNGVGSISAGAGNIYKSKIVSEALDGKDAPKSDAEMFLVKSLGGDVSCRLPLYVYSDDDGTLPHGKTPEQWKNPAKQMLLTALNRSTRLAGVATAWGVFQHFYPYFDVVKTDWDAALVEGLKEAAEDTDEVAYLGTLRELVAKLHDGHGSVYNQSVRPLTLLPVALEWAGKDLVVVGKTGGVPDDVKTGDIVVSIDGRSAEECYQFVSKWISTATDGWRRYLSAQGIIMDLPTADPAVVVLRHPGGAGGAEYTAKLARGQEFPQNTATRKRPENGSELAPGIVYFDLNGADSEALEKVMDKLTGAKGIVFDMRGYPNQAAYEVIQHLIDKNATSAHWNVPLVTRPDHKKWEYPQRPGWDMPPLEPRWKMPVVFMTFGGAISYAESIMGIVEHYKFGEIVGSTTAGTNGNVNPFALPGGYQIAWTGMQVIKHDGSQHHGVGIKPTVPIEPTAAGIAAGRDEVLEKAVEVVKGKMGGK